MPLLEFSKTLQYRGKGKPSDHVIASALIAQHEKLDFGIAKERGLAMRRLSVKQCAQYLSAAFKAKGALDMQLQHDLRCASHPSDQPGHLISACPICAQGADPVALGLEPQEGVEGSSSTGGPVDGIIHPVEASSPTANLIADLLDAVEHAVRRSIFNRLVMTVRLSVAATAF